jgi:dTDP-4-amino-4,6-dideoxygalactose transaminase
MVVEDDAQGILSTYKGKPLGTFGDFGAISFHETKNFSMGEGGALLIREEAYVEKAEILREKGTDRSKYFRGQVDKYRWQNYGSSYLPSDMNAAYLYTQFEMAEEISRARIDRWNQYYRLLTPLAEAGKIELPYIPKECTNNGHMFYIKTKDMEERTALIKFLDKNGIMAVFHYVPLHSAPAGIKFGRFHGEDRYTTRESERLLRLPMFYQLTETETDYIAGKVKEFYGA